MDTKEEVYHWIKIGGIIATIPFVLVSGPLGGYFAGAFLAERFSLSASFPLYGAILGLVGSLVETVRMMRAVVAMDLRRR